LALLREERLVMAKCVRKIGSLLMVMVLCGALPDVVYAQSSPKTSPDPDTGTQGLAAQALLETLNAQLLAANSATLTLEKWCADHRLAVEPKIVAHRDLRADNPVTAEQRQRLGISLSEPVIYRKVQLKCGDLVLSEAENWYVPARLTDEMNSLLTTTQTPFGKVIAPLQPYRKTFAVEKVWSPLSPVPMDYDATAFRHSAVVMDGTNTPLAEVRENYKLNVLKFQK
jgi:chorismate-pyruvate lyase